ncbi:hypothetical protein Pyn_00122 [Prunus yedoensis var. nudiflora]|uniref:Uncharacterized protein n=1 Tax=Prunus yedoensis var. nudiflora TaxID=2094558 RepID=A0A314YUV0_PRUYE|nr:hypothetical protein Pyn_00122 [Prunus yedoensis var. nudiflora]
MRRKLADLQLFLLQVFYVSRSRWSFLCSFYKFSMEIWSNGMMEETSVVHQLYVWMRKAWIRST